jgi:hypothetical protein
MTIDLGTIASGLAASGARFPINKVLPTMEAAGQFHSTWKIAGSPNQSGGVAGANPPAFTAGSGYISNTTGTQTVTTPGTLTAGRDPLSGLDVEPWIEYYTTDGATGGVWTLTGTDSSGNTGRTWTATKPASAQLAGTIIPMLNSTAVGGCRVATSMALSVSSGTAGDCGVTLVRRLAQVTVSLANQEAAKDAIMLGLPEVYDDACLFFVWHNSATTGMQLQGNVGLPELTP